ncbi:hypothetical protein ABVK25_000343 [Lepraria finkii]|uniref:AB hydrolase-1 domain-containing protein n=1 Tax=Lepraria finkii TaxID=1340010 RepID=A0ABR4BML9_9LECA
MERSSAHMFKDFETLRLHLGLAMTTLLGHSNGGSTALGYAERYLERVQKMILLDHQLEGFDDSTTFMAFAMRRKDNPVYNAALVRLQKFKADTDEGDARGFDGRLATPFPGFVWVSIFDEGDDGRFVFFMGLQCSESCRQEDAYVLDRWFGQRDSEDIDLSGQGRRLLQCKSFWENSCRQSEFETGYFRGMWTLCLD